MRPPGRRLVSDICGVVAGVAVAVGWTWTAVLAALFFFGDYVMSLIFTGSLTPPAR